jgi:hypothetical protein
MINDPGVTTTRTNKWQAFSDCRLLARAFGDKFRIIIVTTANSKRKRGPGLIYFKSFSKCYRMDWPLVDSEYNQLRGTEFFLRSRQSVSYSRT